MSGEQLLKQAFSEVAALKLEQIPDTRHIFSLRYRIRKYKLLHSLEYQTAPEPREHTGRIKLKYLLLAIIMACVLALAGFTCYYILNGFSFKVYKDHSIVEYLDIKNVKSTLEEFYYLPETDELRIVNEEAISILSFIQYNYKGSIITFKQGLADVPMHINTECSQVEPLMIGEHNGFFLDMSGETYICWAQDGYIFSLTGNIDKETAVELVETMMIR